MAYGRFNKRVNERVVARVTYAGECVTGASNAVRSTAMTSFTTRRGGRSDS